jgi:uncharacterized caspase-like protein/WD40 repeat protein
MLRRGAAALAFGAGSIAAAALAQQAMPGATPRAAMPAAPTQAAPAQAPAPQPAQAAEPVNEPAQDAVEFFLDLDTGGHRAVIRDLAVSPDGETIVSASEDKTVRVWDWQSGVSIRTIRPEIGDGSEGKIYAVDISPDGELLAVGGFFGPGLGENPPYGDIRIFDLSSGRQLARLQSQQYATYDLDFSPDGSLLAAGGGDGKAYLWRKPAEAGGAWTLETTLDADSWRIEKLAFAAAGARLAAVTQDNGVRLWDLATGAEIDMPAAEELRDVPLQALAVTPDGARFAVATADGRLGLFNAADGTPAGELRAPGFRSDAIAFTGDGTGLVVNCSYRCGDVNRSIVIDVATSDIRAEYRGHDSSVMAVAMMPDGKTVVSAGGTAHEIHLWDATNGTAGKQLKGVGLPVTAVAVDAAGKTIAWGSENPCPQAFACPDVMGTLSRQVMLPAADRDFEDPDPAGPEAARLGRAVHDNAIWSLEAREGGTLDFDNGALHLIRGGATEHVIENDAQTGFYHAAFTLLRRGGELVTGGGDGTLIAYTLADGAFAGEFLGGHTGEVHAMAEAASARLLVTGSADQTIRLWNLDTRQLVVSMFFSADEWIIWTPQGYYHSSPNGDSLVGWQVNQGPDKEARFVRARQLKTHLHSPEIVRRAIILGDAGQAVRELRPTDSRLEELLKRRPPEFEVRIAEGVQAADGFVAIEIVGAQEAGADVNEFAVMSNARRVDQFAARDAGSGDRVIIEVPVEEGQNEILITGVNEFGYVTERGVTAMARKPAEQKKGKLWVVAVGVEEYPNLPADCSGRSCDLEFPVDDAAEFLRVIADRTAPLYEEMEALVMVNQDALDADPERAAIIERLAGDRGILDPESRTIGDEIVDFLDLPGPDDTTIVFVAGHGINIEDDYYFIPTDGRKQDADRWRRSSLVDWADIQKSLERAKGRRILLLDTCHAANAFNPRLEKDAADARIVVFSATAANNTAAELPQLGHGVFTWSVLEGLRGQANTSGDGVRLLGLADFVYREVVRLTQNRQEPFYHIAQTSNFLLARP